MKQLKRSPQIIFLLLGGLLLIIAFLLTVLIHQPSEAIKFWINSIQNIAFVILTIVIVDFLWQIIGGEPVQTTLVALADTLAQMRSSVELLEDSKKTGLHRLLSASGALGNTRYWMDRLRSSQFHIDLLGYTLHIWTRGEQFEEVVISLVRNGACVRVLIMDETNPNLSSLVNEHQIRAVNIHAVKAEIGAAKQAFKFIANELDQEQNLRGSYEFRTLKQGLATSQICRTDSRLTVVQYLYSVVASRSPLIEVYGTDTELFKVYIEEFESLWKLGTKP